ncbi:MAG: ATP-binding cassette domain-containing protein [Chloroherpetonaceae bacterium]|nr:ATP-binding cassette domain-containing protein [Chloroherpetonaceae bacterium]
MAALIRLHNVSLKRGNKVIFDHLDFELGRGEFVYIIGASGAGKSSFLKLLYAETKPDEGEIHVGKFEISKLRKSEIPFLRRNLGIVFQEFRLLFDRNVYENVAFVLEVTGVGSKDISRKVNEALSEVGLLSKKYDMPETLSGGEQQRVAIARAIVREPYFLLADEPTGNLDPEVSTEIMQLLKRISGKGVTTLVVTHDYDIVSRVPSRTLMIKSGKIFDVVLKGN